MEKKILVFSNGEKIGDGIIKLPLLYEIKKRLPEYKLVWVTNKGSTAYRDKLKFIAEQYIDEIIEKADLSPFFWMKVSKNYDFENSFYEYILDTFDGIYLEPNDVITIIDEKTDTSGNYTIVGKSLSCGANTYRLQLTINKRPPILQEFIL